MSEVAGGPPGRIHFPEVAADPAFAGIASPRLAMELLARVLAGELDGRADRYDDDADRFAALGLELSRRLDVGANRFSRAYVATRLVTYLGHEASQAPRLEGATVVELGCGSLNPLSTLFVFVLLGARRAIGVDLDRVMDEAEALRALARCAGWMLTDPSLLVRGLPVSREQIAKHLAATRFDLARLHAGDPAGMDWQRLGLLRESASRLSLGDGEADLCCSTSFLEHVDDVEAVVAELARVTKRGGRGAHSIDAIDHRSYYAPEIAPLRFLEEPAGAPIVHGCNRVRPRAFVPLFERQGFEVVRFHEWRRQEIDDATRASFAEPFRSMADEELACTGATIWVRRR